MDEGDENTLTTQHDLTAAPDVYAFVRAKESAARSYADSVDRVLDSGVLSRVWDVEGRSYLDFLSNAGTLAAGHNHPKLVAAVQDFLTSGHVQQALDITTVAKHRFLTALLHTLPLPFAEHCKIQFCGPSGADATEAALKLFKTATGRSTVLAFHGAYHGMTAGALAMTGNRTAKEHVAGLMPDVHFLPYPYPYRCPFGLGAEGWRTSLTYVERLLADPCSGVRTPAAVFVEPVQGEGGVVPAPPQWLRGLRRITADHGVPLVVDEVQTGFGRTGAMFAFEAAGIEPDAVLMSKAVGGGFPLAVVAYHEKYDVWAPGAHAGTFRGNQIAMAAGAAVLDLIRAEGLAERAMELGHHLAARLCALATTHPEIGDVRGRGLMWGLEIVDPGGAVDPLGSRPADGARAAAVKQTCLDDGLILESGGRHGAVLRLLPPLVVELAELDEAVAILDHALAATR